MRRWISYLMLVLAVAFLASVLMIRSCEERELRNPKYHAALYWTHIQAVDSDSKKAVNFDTRIDYDAVSPFIKGYGPSVEETLPDGSKVVMLVGRTIEGPVMITLSAEGYQSQRVALTSMTSGQISHSQETAIQVIPLQRVRGQASETLLPE